MLRELEVRIVKLTDIINILKHPPIKTRSKQLISRCECEIVLYSSLKHIAHCFQPYIGTENLTSIAIYDGY